MNDKLDEAFDKWRDAIDMAHDFANDAFKAPEQIIETIKPVLDAAWVLQIEYIAALRRGAD